MALTACRGWETENRPIHLIKNMDTQEKGKAYRRDSTGLFADGRMMRAPVEGTVAQGQLGDDDLWERGLDDKGEPTKAFPASVKNADGTALLEDVVARGENRYGIYCTPCHGPNLDGKGTVAGLALDGGPRLTVPPADLHSERVAKDMIIGKLYSAIANGVNAGNMPSYAAQIPVADRWAIVAYVKSAQLKKGTTDRIEPGGIELPVGGGVSAEAGAILYKAKGCNACHSTDGSKIVGPTFKGLWGREEDTSAGKVTVDDAYFKESVLQPMAKVVTGYPPAMPPQQVSDDDLKSLALFIQTLK
jgi:mono/diheme cytochrome c family protein